MCSLTVPPPNNLRTPLTVPQRYMFGPGPSNVPPRILQAGANPVIGHMHPETFELMADIRSGIRYMFQTGNQVTFAVSGTGHAAMECAVFNAVEAGDVVLVAVNGIWGERLAAMAERIGAQVNTIVTSPGGVFTNAEIEQALSKHRPALFFLAHGESSTGVLHPLDGIGQLCHKYDCLFLVDSVASMGGVPVYMDQQEIDILYTGSQKVLNAPPGTAPISFSERACRKIFNRRTKPVSFFLDLSWLSNYWGCDGKDTRMYHHTGPVSAFYSLRESLAVLVEEGLEHSWERHRKVAEYFHAGLERMGLKLFVEDKALRLPTVTTIVVPHGYDWKEITAYVMKTHNLEITGGLGPSAGMVLRVGLMGCNSTISSADMVLAALRDALTHCHKSKV
ncbi:alanine--glyoxylate and serine--pyruvate aminotransferase a isoform X1 [Corythoichthys intestinalis]|uniref:alanine--glyoxylate and serine--pyruvate aminotransferase a isoform X1 n=1 Tax=Corythoichthys intestinalis TaxID=161448 RepID=UPI0025A50040|nr:alanine--glyoxylate and serine--pyruvate aminotransferase a isoform X1 [Corythoichthys intestinalis]